MDLFEGYGAPPRDPRSQRDDGAEERRERGREVFVAVSLPLTNEKVRLRLLLMAGNLCTDRVQRTLYLHFSQDEMAETNMNVL